MFCIRKPVGAMLALHMPGTRRGGLAALRTFASDKPTKKTLQQLAKEINLKGQPVLVRADLNLPRRKEDGIITDNTRARAVRPRYTIAQFEGH